MKFPKGVSVAFGVFPVGSKCVFRSNLFAGTSLCTSRPSIINFQKSSLSFAPPGMRQDIPTTASLDSLGDRGILLGNSWVDQSIRSVMEMVT